MIHAPQKNIYYDDIYYTFKQYYNIVCKNSLDYGIVSGWPCNAVWSCDVGLSFTEEGRTRT